MTMKSYLQSLVDKHVQLDRKIKAIETLAFTNEMQLNEIKRRKLKIKEQIQKVEAAVPRKQ